MRLPHVTSRFANGLELLVAPDPTSDLVHVAMRMKVGSAADPLGKAGLAHLVEHLTFEAHPQGKSIQSRLNRVALAYNAFTGHDATHYMATARADQVLSLLAIEARRLHVTCDQISEDSFARELAVVRNELRFRARDVPFAPGELLAAAYGPDHPYHRLIIGTDAELASMTRADACAFLRAHYAADRAILIVTGGVDPKKVGDMISRLFATVPARATGSLPVAPPAVARHIRKTAAADVDEPTLFAAWPLPRAGHPDREAAEIALEMIGKEVDARDADREYEVSHSHLGGADAPLGVLIVRLADRDAKLAEAEEAVSIAAGNIMSVDNRGEPTATGTNISRTSVSDRMAHSRARAQALIDAVFRFDSPDARAIAYADALQRGARDGLIVDSLTRKRRVELGKVSSVASQFFHPARMIAIHARPAAPSGALEAISYRGTVADPLSESVSPGEASQPMRVPMPAPNATAAKRLVLENGLEVILLPSSSVPTFTARLLFRAGTADDPSGGVAAAGAAYGLTTDLSRLPRWANWSAVSTGWSRGVERDVTAFRVEGLTLWSDSLLAVLGALLVKGDYPRESLRDERKRLDGSDRRRRSRELDAVVAEAVWGKGSRNARVLGPEVGDMDSDAVESFRERFLIARRAALIVTGQFDPEIVIPQIRHSFSGLRQGASNPADANSDRHANASDAIRTSPTIRTISSSRAADKHLIDVVVAIPAPPTTPPAAVQVLAQLFERSAWRLRTVLGASYSTHALLLDEPGGATLGIRATVSADRAADALKSIRADFAALSAGGDDLAAQFVIARRHAVEDLVAPPSGARAAADMLASAAARGRGPEEAAKLASEVAALTITDFQSVATPLVRSEVQAIVLRGSETAIQAALRASGLVTTRARREAAPPARAEATR